MRFPSRLAVPQHLIRASFSPKLLEVNLFLVRFNLLPAFPMDGGRVLRGFLAMRLDYARATRIAASIGQLMAIGFGLLGLTGGNPVLLLIALFVWIGAESEAVQVEERLVLKGVPVRAAMVTEYRTLVPYDTLGHAADLLLAGTQHDFPVVTADGRSAGVLTRSDLMGGLSRGRPRRPCRRLRQDRGRHRRGRAPLGRPWPGSAGGKALASRWSTGAGPSGRSPWRMSANT